MDDESMTLYEELKKEFTDDYIEHVGLLIHELAEKFYEDNALEGQVYFNENIFEHCLVDILVDVARLKQFHDISRINYTKFVAYTASWFLKRKPFQLMEGCDKKYLYVNERFALSLLLQASGCYDASKKYEAESEDELLNAVRQMFYHLKYRNTNPQTLELFLIGIETGLRLCII